MQTFSWSRQLPTMMPALQMSRSRGLPRSLKLSAKSRTLLRDPRSRGATSTCPVWDSFSGVSCSMACKAACAPVGLRSREGSGCDATEIVIAASAAQWPAGGAPEGETLPSSMLHRSPGR